MCGDELDRPEMVSSTFLLELQLWRGVGGGQLELGQKIAKSISYWRRQACLERKRVSIETDAQALGVGRHPGGLLGKITFTLGWKGSRTGLLFCNADVKHLLEMEIRRATKDIF